jgi:Histidine kinase-, DNA gyrase B-, and HSP90-like ATPase
MARINLKKFISEHYKGGITARDVVREAITNSIHANARLIEISLMFSEPSQKSVLGAESRTVLQGISVADDGEGFTEDNLSYFDEICTSHKDSIGGKGVGRLSFLKFANKVTIQSQTAKDFVEFDYTPNFDLSTVTRLQNQGRQYTLIELSQFNEQINTQVSNLVSTICDDLRLLLFLKKQQQQVISLSFKHNSDQSFEQNFTFSADDITSVHKSTFQYEDETFECHLFRDESPKKGIVAMLCADDLCIENYTISKKFNVCRYSIFVTSSYFNSRSNIERQRLEIPATEEETDLISRINRKGLMQKIHDECMNIVGQHSEQDIQSFKKDNLEKLKKYYPYIDSESLGGKADLMDAEEIVKVYRKTQADREDKLIEMLEDGRSTPISDISHLASDDLARYIVHRALVIDSLSKLPRGSAEDEIHNAILPKRSDGKSPHENNIWLLDDKFLSYSSVHSDETLKGIIDSVNDEVESKQKRRPDVAAFFTKDERNNPNKLVIVEFKKPQADVFDNSKALVQCRIYANELVSKISSVLQVFAFAIVDIDDEFYTELKQTNYKDIFSPNERILYQDFKIGSNESVLLHQYVMATTALLQDAKSRNKVFEDILRLNS